MPLGQVVPEALRRLCSVARENLRLWCSAAQPASDSGTAVPTHLWSVLHGGEAVRMATSGGVDQLAAIFWVGNPAGIGGGGGLVVPSLAAAISAFCSPCAAHVSPLAGVRQLRAVTPGDWVSRARRTETCVQMVDHILR